MIEPQEKVLLRELSTFKTGDSEIDDLVSARGLGLAGVQERGAHAWGHSETWETS